MTKNTLDMVSSDKLIELLGTLLDFKIVSESERWKIWVKIRIG
jgi:hypothetical protein